MICSLFQNKQNFRLEQREDFKCQNTRRLSPVINAEYQCGVGRFTQCITGLLQFTPIDTDIQRKQRNRVKYLR